MPGSIAWWLSSSAAGSCRIMERPRRASTITRRWSKSVSGARQGSRRCGLGGEGWSFVVFQSVQLAGISERLPSGSATSNSGVPRRFRVPISRNERPSKGCRSRTIVTEPERSRRWVVCDVFLWQRQPRLADPLPGTPHRRQAHHPSDPQMAQGGYSRRRGRVRS